MSNKRKRRFTAAPLGLQPGQKLKRNAMPNSDASFWGWVGVEATDISQITKDHCLQSCGLSSRNRFSLCANKYSAALQKSEPSSDVAKTSLRTSGELEDDVIVVSDEETPECSQKHCKGNPNCLNYLGQGRWENEDEAWKAFKKVYGLGKSPEADTRDPSFPVGLKNLGATCYANAFLQVLFQDIAFRDGVFRCRASNGLEAGETRSPVFQLQVTFSAMQESIQRVFNPTDLVESLQLRTSEQQDSQEFSKLFMSHLDDEFKKQQDPSLKSLLSDQFQGKQVYGTLCHKCNARSERDSEFLELEINFDADARLEDRIAALLQPEILSGDNQYLCSTCDSLQDATRYAELRELPPVLHFSLLRFVYDFSSMERKKSKHSISFPSTLSMKQFLGSFAQRKAAVSSSIASDQYELRGVLLHKGPSAYHGHYEAQVLDAAHQTWFQCNDEVVTKIQSLGPTIEPKVENTNWSPRESGARNKRKRIDDSEEDAFDVPQQCAANPKSKRITSKDAYMLVYARVQPDRTSSPSLTPSAEALDVVRRLNEGHTIAVNTFQERERDARTRFERLRSQVMAIYRNWNVSSIDERCLIVSRDALAGWLADGAMKSAMPVAKEPLNGQTPVQATEGSKRLASKLACPHNLLDPSRSGDIKRICIDTFLVKDGCIDDLAETAWHPDQVCSGCVTDGFLERLYRIQHPQQVAKFDELCNVEDADLSGYWISKEWLKDWKLVKPKMHTSLKMQDPHPDTSQHVRCVHGGLSHNATARRRISGEACRFLQALFPDWHPIPAEQEVCAVCEADIQTSKEDKRESRRKAEIERVALKHMHDNALNGNTALLEGVPCAIVPVEFVRAWRRWVNKPSEVSRPAFEGNHCFVCPHSALNIDPNMEIDWDSFTLVNADCWQYLEEEYSAGPAIFVEKTHVACNSSVSMRYVHDIRVCIECRERRKLDFDFTDITLRVVTRSGAADRPGTGAKHSSSVVTYSSNRNSGAVRQSTRIRDGKAAAVQKRRTVMTVSKDTTVMEMKQCVQDKLGIISLYQTLFHRGKELRDSSGTIATLQIFSNDVIDIQEEVENEDFSSDEDDSSRKKARGEERGFSGTFLGRSSSPAKVLSEVQTAAAGICPACTYANEGDASSCMCESQLSE